MFGQEVRRRRRQLGLSQARLAERTGLHRTYISDMERGGRNITLNVVYRVADGLGVQVADLFPGPRGSAARSAEPQGPRR